MRKRLVIVAWVALMLGGACSKPTPLVFGEGGCTKVEKLKSEGQGHILAPEKGNYKTDPPTSGKHYSIPAPTGVYETNVPEPETLVHNLEHGHVVVWVLKDRIPAALYGDLVSFVEKNDTRTVLAYRSKPFPNADVNVVFTAWSRMQSCSGTSELIAVALRQFYQGYAGKGPEGEIPGVPRG